MFKVGDIITGLPSNGYGFTNDTAVMRVTFVSLTNQSMGVEVTEILQGGYSGHLGCHISVLNSNDKFTLYDTAYKTIKLSKDFNITEGDITHDEQKDFYTALQNWKLECEEPSTSPELQEVEERTEPLRQPTASRSYQLGSILDADLILGWSRHIAQPYGSSEVSSRQTQGVPHTFTEQYHHNPTVHNHEERSPNMDRAGEQGRSSYILEGAQRGRDRDANLDRFFGRS